MRVVTMSDVFTFLYSLEEEKYDLVTYICARDKGIGIWENKIALFCGFSDEATCSLFSRGKIGSIWAIDIRSLTHVQPPDLHWPQNKPQP